MIFNTDPVDLVNAVKSVFTPDSLLGVKGKEGRPLYSCCSLLHEGAGEGRRASIPVTPFTLPAKQGHLVLSEPGRKNFVLGS